MDKSSLALTLASVAKTKQMANGEYEIVTGAKINSRNPIVLYLTERDGEYYFSDNKNTLKYMSQVYELKSPDVKNCISAVVKIYGYAISSGEILAPIKSEAKLVETYFNTIMCIGQLANMYAFFDKP